MKLNGKSYMEERRNDFEFILIITAADNEQRRKLIIFDEQVKKHFLTKISISQLIYYKVIQETAWPSELVGEMIRYQLCQTHNHIMKNAAGNPETKLQLYGSYRLPALLVKMFQFDSRST